METHSNEPDRLTPWLSIWTQPRNTIQQIVETNPERWVILLACLAGVAQSLSNASNRSTGDDLGLNYILLIAVLIGPIGGLVSLFVGGWLIRWTGSWIGGAGSAVNIRAAIAWSNLPLVYGLALWIIMLPIAGIELFTSETPNLESNLLLALGFMLMGVLQLIIGIWALVILCKCVGQVQGFSAWRGLGNLFLVMLVIIIPVMVIGVVVGVLSQ